MYQNTSRAGNVSKNHSVCRHSIVRANEHVSGILRRVYGHSPFSIIVHVHVGAHVFVQSFVGWFVVGMYI